MPSITSLHLDTTGWNALSQSAQQMIWQHDATGDVLSIEFFNHPTKLPFAMNDVEAIKAHHEQYSVRPDEGAIVSIDLVSLHGPEAVRMIIKARNPRIAGLPPHGMTYLGSLMIPLAGFSYVVKVQCCERGTTGLREAGVALILNPKSSKPTGEVKVVKSLEEMFAARSQRPIVRTPADDERYDTMFPQHPLSRVRTYLNHVEQTIKIDSDVQTARRVEASLS
ncbi:hypothetical protein KSC_029590 [Ktedonobacter sp. SOSP1-52]|nr:hypothetical protein KSC_029590 [Ktedonobacter sp. SOSP1-52]